MIPPTDPRRQYAAHEIAINDAIDRVLREGRYILGEEVARFEREFATYIGVRHGVGVGSGTDAIHIALRSCGVGSGDEVITVSHTAVATVAAIELSGATPVMVDIEPVYFTLDPHCFERAITKRTKAVIVVHLYGGVAAIHEIVALARRHRLRVIEDCAQAHGARIGDTMAGAVGDVSCFSFYPTKNLGAIGDGGLIATNGEEIAANARSLREYGWRRVRYVSDEPGLNSRLDELQAAILRVKLAHLDEANEVRRQIADRYNQGLACSLLQLPKARPSCKHVYHLYVVRCRERDALRTFLERRGVGALVHYPVPIHRQAAYAERFPQTLPETERAAAEVLSLPMFPELTNLEQETVINAITAWSSHFQPLEHR